MTIRNILSRYRAWQRHPFEYKNESHGTVCCRNCGTEFDTNYCPLCGQKAGIGRLTWKSVQESVMSVWGAGNRSMPYSLLQLIGRPGHFIRNYLSGKRQMSYPPFRMLLIVAVFYLFIEHFFCTPETAVYKSPDDFILINLVNYWFVVNPGWAIMIISGLFILPTWIFFRYAPRYPQHTLPEVFFIQVFMSTICLIIEAIDDLTFDWLDSLIFVYYFVAYYQLFGYRVWGTLWRMLLGLLEGVFIMLTLAFVYEFCVTQAPVNPHHTLAMEIFFLVLAQIVNLAILYVVNRINKKKLTLQPKNDSI